MSVFGQPYRIANGETRIQPLGRFLPPLAPGVACAWLAENYAPGQWLLDPLGSNPALALEAARASYRVLVSSNNPILSFILETLATAPRPADFQAALAELAVTRRGSERLEQHLASLYQSECPACGAGLQPLAFLWRREESRPHARLLRCPACGVEGEYPLTPADLERLALTGNDGLHRSRAMERVAQASDENRPQVEEALRSYLPRPLYVLFTLLNRIEGLPAPAGRKRLLLALLLSLFDEANSLWPWPAARARPRQLTVPPQFRENNLYLALETAAQAWSSEAAPLPLTHWPELPPETGGICLYPGRLKSLLPLLETLRPTVALALLPRPNQAFWTLSALWTGWLWGRDAVQPVRSFLERRRYDWSWHANALTGLFSVLNRHAPPGFPILGLIPDLTPGFLGAALTSAQAAGLELVGLAQPASADQAQVAWRTRAPRPSRPAVDLTRLCRSAIEEHLQARGEPDSYAQLFTAALAQTIRIGELPDPGAPYPPDFLTRFQTALARALQEPGWLRRYSNAGQNVESGLWWLEKPAPEYRPLADRVETEILHKLSHEPVPSPLELEQAVYRSFPGLLTPPVAFIHSVIGTFREPERARLRPTEQPEARAAENERGRAALRVLAGRLSLSCSGEEQMLWLTAGGRPIYCLIMPPPGGISAALLSEQLLPPAQCVLVLPERHAGLLLARLPHDPRLNEALAAGWRVLKLEAALRFAEGDQAILEDWEALLSSEPAHWGEARQMQMF